MAFFTRELWLTITPIYQLALMFNSSVNFVIYCLVGEDFKQEFFKLFLPTKKLSFHFWTVANSQLPHDIK